MKFIFSADIHFHNWTDFATINEQGVNSRMADILGVFDQMVEVCKEKDCTEIYLIGDIFHSRTTLDTDIIALVAKKFREITQDHGITITILLGNHDIAASNKDINMLETFKAYCIVIDEACVTEMGEDCEFYNLPYISDKIELKKHLRRLKNLASESDAPYKMLLSHNGLSRAAVGPNEFFIEDPVGVEDLGTELFDLCLFGHYHKPQKLAENVFYVGSPVQHSFGERGDNKGIWLVDSDTGEYEIIPTNAPQFVQCSPDKASEEKAKGNFVQIEAKSKADLVLIESSEDLKKFNVIDTTQKDDASAVRMDISKNTDLAHSAEAYIEYQDTSDYDPEFLKKIASEALQETNT